MTWTLSKLSPYAKEFVPLSEQFPIAPGGPTIVQGVDHLPMLPIYKNGKYNEILPARNSEYLPMLPVYKNSKYNETSISKNTIARQIPEWRNNYIDIELCIKCYDAPKQIRIFGRSVYDVQITTDLNEIMKLSDYSWAEVMSHLIISGLRRKTGKMKRKKNRREHFEYFQDQIKRYCDNYFSAEIMTGSYHYDKHKIIDINCHLNSLDIWIYHKTILESDAESILAGWYHIDFDCEQLKQIFDTNTPNRNKLNKMYTSMINYRMRNALSCMIHVNLIKLIELYTDWKILPLVD